MQNNRILRCQCYPQSECLNVNAIGDSCSTSEGCFRAIQLNKKTLQHNLVLGCFKNRSQHYLMHCKVKDFTSIEIKCCRNRDFCNNFLSLSTEDLLNTTSIVSQPHADQYISENSIKLAFAIVVPLCVVVILACAIFLCWKCLTHNKKAGLKSLYKSKYFPESSALGAKAPLFMTKLAINTHNNVFLKAANGWAVDAFTGSGLPGSKNSSGIAGKSSYTATTVLTDSAQGVTLDKSRDDTCTSGSGSGLPFLVQRTVARQITLLECIGKGKFGEVWKAQFQGELVAVKIFSSREESSWARETKIYTTILLRHDNILGFYASDLISISGCTQLWMIMQYHPRGSLHEYLTENTLNAQAALKLCHSAAAGLCHLHTHILGLQGKPPIAHRDVKSKNILVKNNGTCCIADLGLAAYPESADFNVPLSENGNSRIVGTKRYMAPELLEIACSEAVNNNSDMAANLFSQSNHPIEHPTLNIYGENYIESLKSADVYSFSLVLWEIISRVLFEEYTQPYQLPFGDIVQADPSFHEMYKVVVVDDQRPHISEQMRLHLNPVVRIVEECWHQRPCIRHTMLRVKKSLFTIMNQISNISPPLTDPSHFDVPDFSHLHSKQTE